MTKLCPRGKAAAKRKFKVYPSAYANAYASKICAGKIKDPSGTKRKDFRGPKPAGAKKGALMIIIGVGKKKKVQKKKDGGLIKEKLKTLNKFKMKPQTGSPKVPEKETVTKAIKKLKRAGGGMTAGSMSGMGRLQKARMMNEGGVSKLEALAQRKKALEISNRTKKILGSKGEKSLKQARSEMQVQEGRKKAKKVIGKLKNFKNQSKGFLKEIAGFEKGGLKTELNNPAKGYTKGGMADYYKDLM